MKANEELPEWLAKQKQKNPFKIPENYFEQFESDFLEKVKEVEVPKAKVVHLTRFYRFAAAAVVSGLIIVFGWQLTDQWNSSDKVASFSSLEWEDVESELAALDADELISILNDDDIENIESDLYTPNSKDVERFLLEDIQEEDLEALFN
jgi:hypothetical protein